MEPVFHVTFRIAYNVVLDMMSAPDAAEGMALTMEHVFLVLKQIVYSVI